MKGIDLFSGARGWEARAHKTLGIDLLGIEHWEPAVLTSKAAGLRVLHADVAALYPLDFAGEIGEDGVLVGSPPCQSRSNAGKQLGALDVGIVAECMMSLADGRDRRNELRPACADERSLLTVEPLRWAIALLPRVVVLEQVPPVLPDWKLVGSLLERFGYSWWAGILEAERYGVPQTRERAVLIARRDGVAAHPPEPTHHRFVANEPRPSEITGLFGSLLPWVSMAEALGWDEGVESAPAPTVTGGGGETGGVEVFASARARARARDAVRLRMTTMPNSAEREAGQPAPTIAFGHDSASAQWVGLRAGTNANDITRPAEEPAPTLRFGGRSNDVSWVTNHDRADRVAAGAGNRPRPVDLPAPTIDSTSRQAQWVHDRPSTTVNADPRISKPGHHDENESGSQQKDAVRVTVEQAACLQSFPAGWPFQGSRTAQFTQVGNAVPPLLGEAILRTVVSAEARAAA